MLAWLNPLMLLGGLAVAVPLILHMLLRRRTRLVRFSRIILLQQVQRFSERHFRLKQLLLLMLRLAAILLLAAAFARPWWRNNVPKPGGPAHAVLALIDVSASMRCDDRFDEAADKLAGRLDDLAPGDRAGLMAFGDSPRLLAPLTSDVGSVLAALKSHSAPTWEATDLAAALQAGADLLSEAPEAVRTLLVVSDLQQNGLRRLEKDWRLPEGIAIEVIHVGKSAPPNGSVADVRVTEGESSGVSRAVRALIGYRAPGGTRELNVTLETGGKKIDSRRFALPSGAQRIVAFALPEGVENAEGIVRVDGDVSFTADDARYFIVPPDARRRAIILVGPDDPPDGEALFPAVALQAGGNSPYRVERLTPADFAREEAWRAPFVIVPGQTPLDEPTAARLAACAEAGGVVLLGAAPDAALNPDARAALADVAPIGWIQADPNATLFQMLAEIDMRSQVFSPFRGLRRGNFTAMDFYGHLRVATGPSAVALATFDDGTPALVERRTGLGRVLLWTTTFDPAAGNFALRGLYVAFLRNIAGIAFTRDRASRAVLVGESVPFQGKPGDALTVHRPDRRAVPLAFDAEGAALFRETDLPGAYRVDGAEPAAFSVNINPEESDLDPAWEEDLLALARDKESPDTDAAVAADRQEEDAQSAKVWKALMGALLIIAVAELFLANRTPR